MPNIPIPVLTAEEAEALEAYKVYCTGYSTDFMAWNMPARAPGALQSMIDEEGGFLRAVDALRFGYKVKGQKKPAAPKYDEQNRYYLMAVYFRDKVLAMAESIGFHHASFRKIDLQKWADEFRRMVEIDKSAPPLIREVIDWVTNDDFWRVNCLTPRKLRTKFPEFVLKMKAQKSPSAKQQRNERPTLGSMSDIEQTKKLQEWIDNGGDPSAFPND